MSGIAPIVIATSLAVAGATVMLIETLVGALGRARSKAVLRNDPPVSFLFDRDDLVDTSASGRLLLSRWGDEKPTLEGVVRAMQPRFPELSGLLRNQNGQGKVQLLAEDGSAHLTVSPAGDQLRIDVEPVAHRSEYVEIGAEEFYGIQAELAVLRGVSEALPFAIWHEDEDGQIAWVNRAYIDLCETGLGKASGDLWPIPRVFDERFALGADARYAGRHWIGSPHQNGRPFEVTGVRHGDGVMFTAISADAAVRTENSSRDLVQTLTKTFAQISVGMAVFSRERQMVLFNPALTDLVGLKPEALARRPSLFEFLDTLRDRRMVPEPKDYKSWRARLAEVTSDAPGGGMAETWHLPDGRSFHVTVLPQPGGAMAMLVEDITGQVTQNRSFRGTLELHQILLDRRKEALAVFAHDGALVLCNDGYDQLWGTAHAESLKPVQLADSLDIWKAGALPTSEWDHFPMRHGDASATGGDVLTFAMPDGRHMECRVEPVPGGCLLVEFAPARARTAALPRPANRRLRLLA